MSEAMQKEQLKQVLWRDATFERIVATYDEVMVFVTDAVGRQVRLRASGHINVVWRGHWDESVLETVEICDDAPSITLAKKYVRATYGANPEPGGGIRDLSGSWYSLLLRFLDGALIEIVASSITVEVDNTGKGSGLVT